MKTLESSKEMKVCILQFRYLIAMAKVTIANGHAVLIVQYLYYSKFQTHRNPDVENSIC